MHIPSNTLKQAAWIIISLGVIETLLLIHAIYTQTSFSGGSIIYILLGGFLLTKDKIAYRISQFLFIMLFLFLPAAFVMFFVMAGQVYTATDIPVKWDVFNINSLILLVYMGFICYLTLLLHHPATRTALSLPVYNSDRRTLYVPIKRVIVFPLIFLVFAGLLMGPHLLSNPYKAVTAGLSDDVSVYQKVGKIEKLELLVSNVYNWHSVSIWRIYGEQGNGIYTTVLDRDFNLNITEYGKKSDAGNCKPDDTSANQPVRT